MLRQYKTRAAREGFMPRLFPADKREVEGFNVLLIQCMQANISKTLDTRSWHSFLLQITQNKSWAHPKAISLSRIYKVEMQQASLLYDEAKPQSEPLDSRRFVEDYRVYGAYSKYTVCSRLSRKDDVLRADRDRIGWSPGQGGFKERDTLHAILPFLWFFQHLIMQPPLFSSRTKIPLMWPTFLGQKQFVTGFKYLKPAGYTPLKTETALWNLNWTPQIYSGFKSFPESLSSIGQKIDL